MNRSFRAGFLLLTTGLLLGRLPGYAQAPLPPPDTTTAYTLPRCVELALANNPQVRQAGWQAQTNQVNLTAARGNLLPLVTGGISHGINQGRSIDPFTNNYLNQEVTFANYGLSGSLTLWNGLTLQHAAQQSRLTAEASRLDLQQTRDNVTISVMLAYLQVLNADEQLAQARRQTAVTTRQVERLQLLDRQGAVAPALLADLRGQLAADHLTELTMQANAQAGRLALAQLLTIPFDPALPLAPLPDDPAAPDPSAPTPDARRLLASATATLPMVQAADLRLRAARKGLRAARGQWAPALYAFGNLGTTYSSAASRSVLLGTTEVATANYVVMGPDRVPVYSAVASYRASAIPYAEQWRNNVFSSVGVGLRIPLLNANQARTQLGLARIAEQQAAFQATAAAIQVQQAVEQAVLNQQTAQARYQTLTQQVADFTQAYRAAEARFEAGVGTAVDYLTTKNNLDRAHSNLIAARYDLSLRHHLVAYYQGQPLP